MGTHVEIFHRSDIDVRVHKVAAAPFFYTTPKDFSYGREPMGTCVCGVIRELLCTTCKGRHGFHVLRKNAREKLYENTARLSKMSSSLPRLVH